MSGDGEGEKARCTHTRMVVWWLQAQKLYKENPTLPPWEFHPYLVQNYNDYQGGTQVRYISDTRGSERLTSTHFH